MNRHPVIESRIQVANDVISTFAGVPATITRGGGETLRIQYRFGNHEMDKPLRLRANGSWLAHSNKFPWGGTHSQALAQLVRYIRGLNRFPLEKWRYWTGPKVKLGSSSTIDILSLTDYDDPKKTACVLCGGPQVADWWDVDGVTGPVCSYFSGCRQLVRRRVS